MTRLKIKFSVFVVLVSFIMTAAYAQDDTRAVLSKGTVEEQFQYIVEKSSRYQEFKVIKETSLNALRSNVLDTLRKLKRTLNSTNQTIAAHKSNMDSIKSELQSTNVKLDDTFREKNSIRFLGMLMSKEAYTKTMWFIIGILALILVVLFILYKRSNQITVQNKLDLQETRTEFDKFRKRALEREQELSRNHLAELNKYRKQAGS
jgi:hypothetical protein